ncbi:hypothetical protein HMPREF9248_0509 [Fannyhessea vaginae PB189-T1-4]|uniref:Uncharacterized protein n=1 Tax=Fannyhessea vaginae PB189-T1-4 TaxID=866774 RepID=A0ABN0AZ62_9ACTN|nr:hypothetical protein HMPREF9248_0509 [Fannyhessea vaginae PB189-T1-4]
MLQQTHSTTSAHGVHAEQVMHGVTHTCYTCMHTRMPMHTARNYIATPHQCVFRTHNACNCANTPFSWRFMHRRMRKTTKNTDV